MKRWIEWSAGIGLAAACVMFTGCGGDGVPDPGSDSSAAADSAPDTGEPPAPAPAGGGKAAPVVAQNKGQAASAPKEDADADDKKDAAPAPGENPPAAKSEGGSATAEMLAMATGGQSGSGGTQPPAGGGDADAPGQNPQPGGGPQAAARPGGMAAMAAQMQAQMQARSPGGGGPGGPQAGFPGGSAGAGAQGAAGLGQDNRPVDTRTPEGAVCAFLNALQAKDRDRLAEATALRSQAEASTEKNKELFGKIVDMSISDTEIDDLAKKLQGFQVAGENAVKSTGRLGIFIDKPTGEGGVLRVTLTVRKEKKGWGVVDIGHSTEFKPMGNMNQRRKASIRGGS